MQSQMTIGRKFKLSSALLIAFTAILGLVSLMGISRVGVQTISLSTDGLDGVSDGGKLESALLELRGNFIKHIASTNAGEKAALEEPISRLKRDVLDRFKAVNDTVTGDEEQIIVSRVRVALDRYFALWDEVLPLSRAGKAEAFQKYDTGTDLFIEARDAVRAENEFNLRLGKIGSRCCGCSQHPDAVDGSRDPRDFCPQRNRAGVVHRT